jgi:hypothetical protein
MRSIWTVLALTMVVGCSGADGKDGADGADGAQGTAGPAGVDGDDGADGADGKGDTGADGSDGSNGSNGASVRTGEGAPAAGLGSVGDVYIDSTTGDLYAKEAGGWAKTGNLKGADGADGVDVKDTVGGVRWFAFALTAGFVDAPNLLKGETYTPTSSSASFAFTGAAQHGRLAFRTAGSYLPGGVSLLAFESIALTATVTGGDTTNLVLLLTDGDNKGCQYEMSAATGPVYSIDLYAPSSCYNDTLAEEDFALWSVTNVQVGIISSAAGSRTLTVNDIEFVDSN